MEQSITEKINVAFAGLTAAEKQAARTLVQNFPWAGMGTVDDFSAAANVSSATIVRFVQSLGFRGFKEFQKALIRESALRDVSPLARADEAAGPLAPKDSGLVGVFRGAGAWYVEGIAETFANTNMEELVAAASILSDPSKRVFAFGGTFSHVLAQHLVSQLQLFRSGLHYVRTGSLEMSDRLSSIVEGDVFVCFDFRRYSMAALNCSQIAAERGAKVLLITDQWLSPASKYATSTLIARVEAPGPSDTMVPAFAMVEALCECVVDALGESGLKRLRAIEALRGGEI
ncbi:MurR/RpiR family transcriptional regulator [Corynebacterium lizhenjunii]|uniref:MurR/RpiR family transcriptional regulator n=1 Tax=Corynebacterium lizhenjunii TaxID=2709394 RepID=A0A7T0P9H4_9CORY|nr:MurR/RpiR family transcriptional regulator [Corynebacterium lizhenjunii]QPK78778.1 MurR/RpiR family transcriptional regulator [Corynebacterium lizhenjunii]